LNNHKSEKYGFAYSSIKNSYRLLPKDDRVLQIKMELESRLGLKTELERTREELEKLKLEKQK